MAVFFENVDNWRDDAGKKYLSDGFDARPKILTIAAMVKMRGG
jgi:hypothetical protein